MTKYSDLWAYGGIHSENTIGNIFLVRMWRNGNICRLMVTMWNEMAALWNSLVFSHILLPWTNANTNIIHNIPNQPNCSSVKEWVNTIWHTHTVEYCSDIMKYWLCWCTLKTYDVNICLHNIQMQTTIILLNFIHQRCLKKMNPKKLKAH